MSAESVEREASESRSTSSSSSRSRSESSGSRVNPTNWPDHLRKYRPRRPDEPSARETQNPHEWDNPDPSILERATPDTTAGWLVAWALGLITLAVLAYLAPIFFSFVFDPLVITGLFLGGMVIGSYLKGRIDGIEAYRDLDKSILYYGDDADARAGKKVGESGPESLFTALRDFSLAGFKKRYLLKRDLPYPASKLRSNSGKDVGDEEAVDALNKTTVEIETETLGRILITHASDLDDAPQSSDCDRYTPLPDRFDEDVAEDVSILIRRLRRKIKELKADVEELERAASDARDLRQKQLAPELEQALLMINTLQSTVDDDDQRKSGQTDDSAGLEAIREAAEKSKNKGGWSS